jgi:rhomboid protease GluP
MDTNLVLLWMASAICLAIALRVLALRSRRGLSWLAVSAMVLTAEAVVYTLRPAIAGYVGAALAALLVIAPLYAGAAVTRLVARRRFAGARVLAHAVRVLHPTRDFREFPGYVRALEQLHRGELDAASSIAARPSTPLGRFVRVQALRTGCRWAELLAYIDALPSDLRGDPGLALSRVRALAELGELEAMLQAHGRIESTPGLAGVRDLSRMIVAARLGLRDLVERLLEGSLARSLPADAAPFWRATALQASGDPRAQPLLVQLLTRDPDIARAARHRLAVPLPPVRWQDLPAAGQEAVQQLAREIESARGLAGSGARSPATLLLIASLVVVFAFELPGGATDLENLYALGALLIPPEPGAAHGLRLLTAAFLHFGAMHLVMNALGLWVLARPVETILGAPRMLALFVAGALAGNLAALVLLPGPTLLVGASGGVMGMLGALLAITLRRFRKSRTRFLRGHLSNWLLVIAIQVFFDLSMPAVSSTAHMGGFAAGLLLGLLLSNERAAR